MFHVPHLHTIADAYRDQSMNFKVALITGAAKRVGAEIARGLHQAGFAIALHYRGSELDAKALKAELEFIRPNSVALFQCDLNELAKVPELITAVIAHFGRLDALVNNASSFYPTPLGDIGVTQIQDLFASNAFAPLLLVQAAETALRAANGAVVNIVDIYAERPLARYTPYCMAKAALVAATYALARELGPEVRVNGIAPGNIIWSGNMEKAETPLIVQERTALKRQGGPSDIATTVKFLICDAPYITGQILRVDGGRWLFI
jgi:pteridine reductase